MAIQESCDAVKGFPLGFPTLQIFTCLWNRGVSLLLRCQGGRRSQVEATDALIIQLTPRCHAGKSRGALSKEEVFRGNDCIAICVNKDLPSSLFVLELFIQFVEHLEEHEFSEK
ncbi:hypothetical protein P3S68_002670 [Capsicum galapagoense]